jgi:hypothetical protein
MTTTPTIIERASEVAKSGTVQDMTGLRLQLKAEGYPLVDAHLAGASLSRQLAALIRTATGQPPIGGSRPKAN